MYNKDMTKTSKHPKLDANIHFHDDVHRYYDDNGIRYSGVTTLIHDWFPEFDSEGMALKCSKNPKKKEYYGMKVEDIVQQWADKAQKSCDFGTKVHDYCEKVLKLGKIEKNGEKPFEENEFLDSFLGGLVEEYDLITPEKLIFSPSLRLATMVDVLAVHRKTGHVLIGDWKTSRKLDKKSFYNRATNEYAVGLGDLSCVQDCNYQKYALQVNLCQEILERECYFPPETRFVKKIFHTKFDGRSKKWSMEEHTIREKRKPIEIMVDSRLAEVALLEMDEGKEF